MAGSGLAGQECGGRIGMLCAARPAQGLGVLAPLDARAHLAYEAGLATQAAGVAELVDAADSKSAGRKALPVRFWPPAPILSIT